MLDTDFKVHPGFTSIASLDDDGPRLSKNQKRRGRQGLKKQMLQAISSSSKIPGLTPSYQLPDTERRDSPPSSVRHATCCEKPSTDRITHASHVLHRNINFTESDLGSLSVSAIVNKSLELSPLNDSEFPPLPCVAAGPCRTRKTGVDEKTDRQSCHHDLKSGGISKRANDTKCAKKSIKNKGSVFIANCKSSMIANNVFAVVASDKNTGTAAIGESICIGSEHILKGGTCERGKITDERSLQSIDSAGQPSKHAVCPVNQHTLNTTQVNTDNTFGKTIPGFALFEGVNNLTPVQTNANSFLDAPSIAEAKIQSTVSKQLPAPQKPWEKPEQSNKVICDLESTETVGTYNEDDYLLRKRSFLKSTDNIFPNDCTASTEQSKDMLHLNVEGGNIMRAPDETEIWKENCQATDLASTARNVCAPDNSMKFGVSVNHILPVIEPNSDYPFKNSVAVCNRQPHLLIGQAQEQKNQDKEYSILQQVPSFADDKSNSLLPKSYFQFGDFEANDQQIKFRAAKVECEMSPGLAPVLNDSHSSTVTLMPMNYGREYQPDIKRQDMRSPIGGNDQRKINAVPLKFEDTQMEYMSIRKLDIYSSLNENPAKLLCVLPSSNENHFDTHETPLDGISMGPSDSFCNSHDVLAIADRLNNPFAVSATANEKTLVSGHEPYASDPIFHQTDWSRYQANLAPMRTPPQMVPIQNQNTMVAHHQQIKRDAEILPRFGYSTVIPERNADKPVNINLLEINTQTSKPVFGKLGCPDQKRNEYFPQALKQSIPDLNKIGNPLQLDGYPQGVCTDINMDSIHDGGARLIKSFNGVAPCLLNTTVEQEKQFPECIGQEYAQILSLLQGRMSMQPPHAEVAAQRAPDPMDLWRSLEHTNMHMGGKHERETNMHFAGMIGAVIPDQIHEFKPAQRLSMKQEPWSLSNLHNVENMGGIAGMLSRATDLSRIAHS